MRHAKYCYGEDWPRRAGATTNEKVLQPVQEDNYLSIFNTMNRTEMNVIGHTLRANSSLRTALEERIKAKTKKYDVELDNG